MATREGELDREHSGSASTSEHEDRLTEGLAAKSVICKAPHCAPLIKVGSISTHKKQGEARASPSARGARARPLWRARAAPARAHKVGIGRLQKIGSSHIPS
eukprot:scaffold244259_cov33-Tisochrysis_lutea.AAC.2